jgi:hypothetical protein
VQLYTKHFPPILFEFLSLYMFLEQKGAKVSKHACPWRLLSKEDIFLAPLTDQFKN